MPIKAEKVYVVIKNQNPTKEDIEAVSGVEDKVAFVWGGKFFQCVQSERLNTKKLINLTDREDINEFYKDVLVHVAKKEDVKSEEKAVKPTEDKESTEAATEEKPKRNTRGTKSVKTSTLKGA